MCLSTILKNPIKAKKEIEVYKVIDQDNTSPFFDGYGYHYGYNRPSGIKQVDRDPDCPGRYEVYGGFLHAFTDESRAVEFATELNHSPLGSNPLGRVRNFRVVKMYVPVGADYYVDHFSEEICAEKLLWREEKEEE